MRTQEQLCSFSNNKQKYKKNFQIINSSQIWIRISAKVKKWRMKNKRIYTQILQFGEDSEKYILLGYFELETKLVKTELYCITKQFKPFFYYFSKKESEKIFKSPWKILEIMKIDIKNKIFKPEGIEYSEGIKRNMEKKPTMKSNEIEKKVQRNYNKQKTLKSKKTKKKNAKSKFVNLKTLEDDFDIDIENNEGDDKELSDYIIDLDDNGNEIDGL